VVFDSVGWAMFAQSLAMLAPRGRLVFFAFVGQREVSIDLVNFYHKESQIFGVDTLKRALVASGKVLEAITLGFEDGSFRPPVFDSVVPLSEAAAAYRRVAAGAHGRIVLDPR
jgi:NADPH2:quinone reductase